MQIFVEVHFLIVFSIVVLPGMTAEGKRTEFRPISDHDGLIGKNSPNHVCLPCHVTAFPSLIGFIRASPTFQLFAALSN